MSTTTGRSAKLRCDIVVSQGSDQTFRFTWATKAAPDDAPTPVDLTGWTGRAQIRDRIGGKVYADISGANVALGSDGSIAVVLANDVSSAWSDAFRAGVWDLELTDPAGHITRFAEGRVRVSNDVTRGD